MVYTGAMIASFHLDLADNDELVEINGKDFDAKAYSRMKYGVRADMKYFALKLADELRVSAPELYTDILPPAILTSYKAAAPPGTTVARYCLDSINIARFEQGLQPGEMVQVYRPQDYIQEYAHLPVEERKLLMNSQADNTLRNRDLSGSIAVILDDICVTGTYTAMMERVIGDHPRIVKAYLVACEPKLKAMPHVEGKLNTSEIRRPSDLLPYIAEDNFVFSRRFLKMLLRTNPTELHDVMSKLPDMLVEQVVRGIIDTGPELGHIFAEETKIIFNEARQRHIFTVS